jgi:hypothetical protein
MPGSTSTLTITTTAPSLFVPILPRGLWPLSLLCLLLVLMVVMVRQSRPRLAYCVFGAMICAVVIAGCGGGGIHNPGTPTGTYTITVTGTSNQLQHSATLTLTVQ